MRLALLAQDAPTAAVLQALLKRVGVDVAPFGLPRDRTNEELEKRIAVLRESFDDVLITGVAKPPTGARPLNAEPSLGAWLTRDPKANREVLGTDEVPAADEAARWLREQTVAGGKRRFSLTLEGKALAEKLDLSTLMEFSPVLRSLVFSMRPTWANEQPLRRSAGRPPGIAMFRGTGYAFCLELLHLGARTEVTVAQMMTALSRTKTPVLNLIQEAQRRGFLHRASPRGPLQIRQTERLVDEMVVDVKARRTNRAEHTRGLSADRDSKNLVTRLSHRFAERGRIFAITGAPAVRAWGGELLIGGPALAYTSLANLDGSLGDAFDDPVAPQLILIEPQEEAVFHRMEPGEIPSVSPWQAVIDLLASPNDREREVGMEVKRRLLEESS